MTYITKLPYFFLIGKQPFNQLHDLLLLQIFEYLYNGTFIVSYDINTRQFVTTINKKCPSITKTLIYKQLHTPYFEYLTAGNKQRLIVTINPHGKGLITDSIWYDLIKRQIIYHISKTDSRRRALITRWNNYYNKKRLLKQFKLLTLSIREKTKLPSITKQQYIQNTYFKKPLLSRSCITKHF